MFSEIPCSTSSSIRETCIEAQQLRATFPNDKRRRASKLLDVAHSDMVGHIGDVVFIDDCTKL